MGTFRRCESNDPVCKQAAVGDCQLVNIELWGAGGTGGPRGLPSQMVVFCSSGPDSISDAGVCR